jgi:hypothetical protein
MSKGQGVFCRKKYPEGTLICPFYGQVTVVKYHPNGDWDLEFSQDFGHRERYYLLQIFSICDIRKHTLSYLIILYFMYLHIKGL